MGLIDTASRHVSIHSESHVVSLLATYTYTYKKMLKMINRLFYKKTKATKSYFFWLLRVEVYWWRKKRLEDDISSKLWCSVVMVQRAITNDCNDNAHIHFFIISRETVDILDWTNYRDKVLAKAIKTQLTQLITGY